VLVWRHGAFAPLPPADLAKLIADTAGARAQIKNSP
jgi:hypothetical protein